MLYTSDIEVCIRVTLKNSKRSTVFCAPLYFLFFCFTVYSIHFNSRGVLLLSSALSVAFGSKNRPLICLEHCHSSTGVCHPAVSAMRKETGLYCHRHPWQGGYYQWAYWQSSWRRTHKVEGVSECDWCWLAEDTRPIWPGTQMDACKDARTYPWGQWHVCRRTQEGSEAIQGIWRLLPRALCPVVLLVLLRSEILHIWCRSSHAGWQMAQLVLIII